MSIHRLEMAKALQEWYQLWDFRLAIWLSKEDMAPFEHIIEQLPAIIELSIALLRDARIPQAMDAELIAAGEYLLNPVDLLPEGRLGVLGLLEDAAILSTPLQKIADWDAEMIYSLWTGETDPIEEIANICQQREAIIQFAIDQRK